MGIKPIPDGYRTVTPFLVVDDGVGAIDYYKQAFGAKERMRAAAPRPSRSGSLLYVNRRSL